MDVIYTSQLVVFNFQIKPKFPKFQFQAGTLCQSFGNHVLGLISPSQLNVKLQKIIHVH